MLTTGSIDVDAAARIVLIIVKDEIWVGDNVESEAHDDEEIAAEELFNVTGRSCERNPKGVTNEAETNLAVVAWEGKGRDGVFRFRGDDAAKHVCCDNGPFGEEVVGEICFLEACLGSSFDKVQEVLGLVGVVVIEDGGRGRCGSGMEG